MRPFTPPATAHAWPAISPVAWGKPAMVVGPMPENRLEIGSAMANHAAYLGHWIELLRASPQLLLQVVGDARRAADQICPEEAVANGR
jgi:hypothetical protein